MKVFTSVLFALIFVACIELSIGAPKKNECQGICAADYTPVCGKPAEGKGTDITFGNKCVLDNYNCEKKDKPYVKSADGECPGKAPVRL